MNNKLVFQIEYAKRLSDRLIQNKTLSINAEKNLISKLKAEAGVTYVNKMTLMMQDLETSKTVMDKYRSLSHRGNPNGIAFNVQVLQQGAWEVDKIKFDKFTINPCIQKCMDDFNTFYTKDHKTHKLLWCLGLGTLELQYLYLKKPYQSISTLCQYAILCTLEKYQRIKVEKISEILGHNLNVVVNDANALIFSPLFNPAKMIANGLVNSNGQDKVDLKPENEVWINKDFMANNLKFATIPTAARVL